MNVRFNFRFQINTFEVDKRIIEVLKPKENGVVQFFFSDDVESFIVISLPNKLNDRFLNGIFSNKSRESSKARGQVNECTNGRLERIGGFPPWTLGFPQPWWGLTISSNKKNG
jgi:hypothetical protein